MKYKLELFIILVISIGIAALLPGFMLASKTIVYRSFTELAITSLMVFTVLSLTLFGFKKSKN